MNILNIKYKYTLIIILTIILLSIGFMSPVVADDIGPSHDLNRTNDADDVLEVDIGVATDENGEPMTSDAAITYDVTITTQNARNTYPYIYPIDMNILENDDLIQSQTIFLNPTRNENYTPSYGGSGDRQNYELKENFRVYITFNDQFESDLSAEGYLRRNIEFEFSSRFTNDNAFVSTFDDVAGTTPQGRSASDASISATSGVDDPTEVNHVDRYRLHESESSFGFLEDSAIPYQSDYSGSITNFQNMREPDSAGSSLMRSDDNGLKLVTQTRNVHRAEPQTIVITYNIFDGDSINVEPLRADMESIDSDTEYIIPENPDDSEYCQTLPSNDGLCVFTLSSEEVDEINQLGELYLEYNSNNEDVSVEIFCQGIISGYFDTDDVTCGNSGLISSDLIEIAEFEGKQISSDDRYDYFSGNVPLEFNRGSTGYNADVSMYSSIRTNLDEDETIPVDVAIVKQEDINSSGISDSIAFEDNVILEEGDNLAIETEHNIDSDDVVDTYFAVVCRPGTFGTEDCSSIDNVDISELNFGVYGDNSPILNVRSPILIELSRIGSERIVDERIQAQTTDSTFADGNDWYRLDDRTINEFTGEIEESVTVQNVISSNPSGYENRAEDKLSIISPEGEWIYDDYDTFISTNQTDRTFIPDGEEMSGSGWERVSATPERTAQIGMEERSFDVVSGSEFLGITDSERGWYLDRDNEVSQSSNDQTETLYRHTDPDDCYNCLTAEYHDPNSAEMTEAEARFENTSGQDIIYTPGENNWELISNEAIIATLRENNVTFRYTSSSLEGPTKIFENSNTNDAVWRSGEFDERGINQWERTTNINQLPFKAPIREDVTEWQRETYDIEYVYSGEINNPTNLYTYQKDIETEIVDWEPKPVWYDFSNSEPHPDGQRLSQIRVSYVGTSEVHYVDWIDNVHTQTPDEIDENISEICDSGTSNVEEISGGTGGIGIIETCDIDGEEEIIKIGKKYNEEGAFNPEITLLDTSMSSTTKNIRVNVNEGAGIPEFNVEAINPRVDYNVGTVAIDGYITAPTVDLGETYQLEITPSDSFSGTEGCPASYRTEEQLDIQMQTTTTDTFRQTNDCLYNAFEDVEDIPEEFERYTQTQDGIFVEDIPAGAIQNCSGSALGNVSSDERCYVLDSYAGDDTDDTIIQYKSGSSYNSIAGNNFIPEYCPEGYELEEVENNRATVSEYSCNLSVDAEFSIMSRQISVDYNSIQRGVIEQCSDIVTSSETGSHSGYTNVGSGDDEYCQLVDESNPGPSEFMLYDSAQDTYNSPPEGAVRGTRYVSTRNTLGNCSSFETSDGNLYCEYENNDGSTTTINYASLTEGSWNYVPQGIDKMDIDIDDTKEIIWESDFVLSSETDSIENPEERITTAINPRQIPFDSEQIGENTSVEFEFTLRPANDDGVIQTETVEIQLCQAPQGTDVFPRETIGNNECDNFDTLLGGTTDFDTNRTTLDDARQSYIDTGQTQHTIDSIKNDICPYNLNYPHGHNDIEGYTINVGPSTDWNEIREELEAQIRHRYAIGDPCVIDENLDITPAQNQQTYSFTADSFRQPEDVMNVRRIGTTELTATHGQATTQSLWGDNDLGHSLRLGSPIITNPEDSLNEHLVSAYTFDHRGAGDYTLDMFGNGDISAIPNRITDTYTPRLYGYDEYLANYGGSKEDYENYVYSRTSSGNDVHHARLAFGSACTTGTNSEIRHEHSNLEGISCDDDIMDREEAIDAFSGDEFNTPYASSQNIERQSAILSAPPRGNSSDSIYNIDEYHYGEGLFGGNSLHLNDTSWLMITPPCIDRSEVGTTIDAQNDEYAPVDSDSCTYDGGYSVLYHGGSQIPIDGLAEKLSDSNYTFSFWVREEVEGSREAQQHPVRTLFSLSQPSTEIGIGQAGIGFSEDFWNSPQMIEPPYAHTSAELSMMNIPTNRDEQLIYPDSIDGNDMTRALTTVFPKSEFTGPDGFTTFVNPVSSPYSEYIGDYGTVGINNDFGEDDYYAVQANDYELSEWKHVTVTSEKNGTDDSSPRTFDVYIDGKIQDTSNFSQLQRFVKNGDSQDAQNPFLLESGGIYEDSVVSIGARYLDAGYGQNGEYAPQIEASAGNIYIDDLRIYNESVSILNDETFEQDDEDDESFLRQLYNNHLYFTCVAQPWREGCGSDLDDDADGTEQEVQNRNFKRTSDIGQIYHAANEQAGYIRSSELTRDANQKQIEDISSLSRITVNADYDGDGDFQLSIIPCEEGGECIDSAAAIVDTSTDFNSDNVANTNFNMSAINIDTVDNIKLDVSLRSDDITETPIINDLDITFDTAPYQTCQEILMNSPSFAGHDFTAQLTEIDNSGDFGSLSTYDTDCDMTTDGGGWTQFYWAEEGGEYNSDIDMKDRLVDDCNESSCFTTANFNKTSNLNITDFPEHMEIEDESDLRPQILIKSISDGSTQNWVALELTDFATDGENDYTRFLNDYFTGEDAENVLRTNTFNYFDFYGDDACIYPYASSQDYDSDFCITNSYNSNDNLVLSHWTDMGYYTHMFVERNDADGRVTNITCLDDRNADRCEVYYRISSSGDYPDDLGLVRFNS